MKYNLDLLRRIDFQSSQQSNAEVDQYQISRWRDQARRICSKSAAQDAIRRHASASFTWSTTSPMRMCPAALGPKASPASTDTP
jgi:hypothetical protein